MQNLRYLEKVVTLQLDRQMCVGCGLCLAICPHQVFRLAAGKAELADRDGCIECGACARNCAAGAISVKPGVGCASAIVKGWLTGTEPSCDCSGGSDCC